MNMALRKLSSVIVCEIVHLAVNVNETLFSNVLKHGFSLDSVRSWIENSWLVNYSSQAVA